MKRNIEGRRRQSEMVRCNGDGATSRSGKAFHLGNVGKVKKRKLFHRGISLKKPKKNLNKGERGIP